MTSINPEPAPPPPPSGPAESRQPPAPPPTNAGWAVATLVAFWPLAFSAFSNAFEVYPRWARGDYAGARSASNRVRRLGQLSLWLLGGILVLVVIAYVVLTAAWISREGSWYDNGLMHW
ncbi:CD225/dispanin family protein [Rhodococcus spongiicola]|uniref:CD225/dispanin family protein n=1 Tax=Rhodococcus spongiicola TaxID=2487352 RepID=A0A3S3AK52_9NOCA|nr:CD225/dispanin family protein [Rhodococcus spongiicola]RVW06609.1 CD225/dispanin family protein [Rhodococcus spongiicola]